MESTRTTVTGSILLHNATQSGMMNWMELRACKQARVLCSAGSNPVVLGKSGETRRRRNREGHLSSKSYLQPDGRACQRRRGLSWMDQFGVSRESRMCLP